MSRFTRRRAADAVSRTMHVAQLSSRMSVPTPDNEAARKQHKLLNTLMLRVPGARSFRADNGPCLNKTAFCQHASSLPPWHGAPFDQLCARTQESRKDGACAVPFAAGPFFSESQFPGGPKSLLRPRPKPLSWPSHTHIRNENATFSQEPG